jgi:hypothetical protein
MIWRGHQLDRVIGPEMTCYPERKVKLSAVRWVLSGKRRVTIGERATRVNKTDTVW